VRATGAPLGAAFFRGNRWPAPSIARRFRRIPQLASRKPFHHDIGIRAFELIEGGKQFLGFASAKRRRRVVDQDRPVGEARWHPRIVADLTRKAAMTAGPIFVATGSDAIVTVPGAIALTALSNGIMAVVATRNVSVIAKAR